MGVFAGTEWYIIFPLGGSLVLFATCPWILLWPRVGSLLAFLCLLGVASWPALALIDDVSKREFADALIWISYLVVIAAAAWLVSREALGFTQHTPLQRGTAYTGFAVLLIIALPALVSLNFYSTSRTPEVREFPAGFHGTAFIIWGEPKYPALPRVGGKFIEHFGTDGVLITSTPQQSGWARDQLYFYDAAGNRVKNSRDDILVASGQIGNTGRAMHYSELFVGTERARTERSEELFAQKEKRVSELFKKLHPEWSD